MQALISPSVETPCYFQYIGGPLMQELALHVGCTKPHAFHPALVSAPLQANSNGFCSLMSVHNSRAVPEVSLGIFAVFRPQAAPHVAVAGHCSTEEYACQCLCTAVATVKLSPAVQAWNSVFPFARFLPQASAPCCAGNAVVVPFRSVSGTAPPQNACP